MKNFTRLFIILLLFVTSVVAAQETSSWINYNQNYVRVGVTVKGLQKITFSQLNAAGLGVNASNVDKLQLFYRGQEVAIVKIENEDVYFYGVLNDGASDSLLFRPTTSNLNKRYSRYSTEGSYFFTLSNSTGKRAQTSNAPTVSEQPAINWHWEQLLVMNRNQYSNDPNGLIPGIMQSYFKSGESLTGTVIQGTNGANISLPLSNRYTGTFISPRLEYMLNGRVDGTISYPYAIKAQLSNRVIINGSVAGFTGVKGHYNEFVSSDMSPTNLTVRFEGGNTNSRISATYAFLEYPQLNIMSGTSKYFYFDASNNSTDRIEITNVTTPTYTLLDISSILDPKIITNTTYASNKISAYIERENGRKSTLLLATNANQPTNIKAINFTPLNPNDYNYIIITNNKLRSATDQYAAYRASSAGGNYKVLVRDIIDIYAQYNYGEPSPVAIQHFAKHMASDQTPTPKNLFLIGWTVTWHTRVPNELTGVMPVPAPAFQDPSLINYDYIPSIGYPGSDMLLVDNIGLNARENIPGMGIGRLPAITPQQVLDYLEKVIEYEDPSKSYDWKKNVISVSGGGKNGASEVTQIKNSLDQLNTEFTRSYLGGNLKRISKDPNNFIVSTDLDISSYVNEGVGLVTFYGHGNALRTDYDFGYISKNSSKYTENGKYPFLYYVGCGVSNIFSSRYLYNTNQTSVEVAVSTDWLFSKRKGAIAVMSNTYDSYLSTAHELLTSISKYLLREATPLTIGEVQVKAAREIITTKPLSDIRVANLHQSLLQGDPALRLVRVDKSEYLTSYDEGLFITSGDENVLLKDAVDPKIGITIKNHGKYDSSLPLNYRVKFNYKGGSNKIVNLSMPNVALADTHFVSLNSTEGAASRTLSINDLNSIEVTLNPDNTLSEFDYSNNTSLLRFDWTKAQNYPLWTSTEAALPVKLVSFSVTNETKNSTLISWSTIEEINAKRFYIEKSYDGKNWSTIGDVEAIGTSTQLEHYQFHDSQTLEGINFYRLKMVDLDNTFDYSIIRSIIVEGDVTIAAYPNPSSDVIKIKSALIDKEKSAKLLIQDITGRTIISQTISTNQTPISVNHLMPGVYILKVQANNGQEQVTKFVKQ